MASYQQQGPGAQPPITANTRQEFGATESHQQTGTQDSALAAQMQAQVQARYVMAMRQPRDWDAVRQDLKKQCQRLYFADAARYKKPVDGKGNTVEGWSIRFVEAALRSMRNTHTEILTIYDDDRKRVVRVMVTDLECNTTYSQDITVDKLVERLYLKKGQIPVRSRTNASGQTTHTVVASEADLANKIGAEVSKSMRNNGLRLFPGDIADEMLDVVTDTQSREIEANPDESRRKIIDAFAAISVDLAQLLKYLNVGSGKEISPADIIDLRKLYTGLKNGDLRWADAMDARREAHADEDEQPSKRKELAAKIKGRSKAKAETSDDGDDDQADPETGEVADEDTQALINAARENEAAKNEKGGR